MPNDGKYTNVLASSVFMNESYEPARTNNFELQITGLDTLVKAGYSSEDTNKGYSAEIAARLEKTETVQELILSVKSAFSPKTSISVLDIPYGNTRTKFAGIPSWDSGQITWVDYYDLDTELILKAWQAAAVNEETGAVGDAKNYKRTCYLTTFSPSGRKARRYKLINCWISDVNADDLSNENNSIRGLAATFVYDKAVRLEDWTSEGVNSALETYNG